MNILSVIGHYFAWHYSTALFRFSVIYRDIVIFVKNFFSLGVLLRSFLSPWRRLNEPYPENRFDLSEMASVFVVNILMRLVGIFIRSIFIIIGLMALILTLALYPVLLLFWLVLPLVIGLFVLIGVKLLFF